MAMPKFQDPMEGQVTVLKTGRCDSLSGKSDLTYQLGCTEDNEIYARISDNTGGGFFSKEWVSLKAIQDVLEDNPEDEPLTSFMIQGLFIGKSVNTPAFLMAALVQERWLRVLKGKKRGLEVLDTPKFMAKMSRLVTTKKNAKARRPSSKKKKKTAIKSPASNARKTASGAL